MITSISHFAEPAAAVRLEHVDVGEIRIRRLIGDHAREPDLRAAVVDPEADGARDAAPDDVFGNAGRPVAPGQKCVDGGDVDARAVCRDDVLTAHALDRRRAASRLARVTNGVGHR